MKFQRSIYSIVTIVTILVAGSTIAIAQQNPPSDKVALVNGVAITRSAYDRELTILKNRSVQEGKKLSDQEMAQAKVAILERLVEGELLYQESKKQGVRIDTKAIDGRLAEIKKRFSNDEEYKKTLSQMGITEAEVRDQIDKGLAINQLIKTKVIDKITISEKESKAFYDSHPELFKQNEQVKARHILIKVAPDADEKAKAEARKKIEDVQKKVKAGEDFAELARKFSEGPSGKNGGDLGYFGRGKMVKSFEAVAFSMKPGEVSDVVETRFGYHLIKVEDKKQAKPLAYADVKTKLDGHLKQQKEQLEIDKYISDLKKNAKIEKFL